MEEIKKRPRRPEKSHSDKFLAKSEYFEIKKLMLGGKEYKFNTQEEARKIIDEYMAKKRAERGEE